MSRLAILRRLKDGPATNRQLQEVCCDHGGAIARDCADLMKSGRVVRIDGRRGRGAGKEATYALRERP
jgi:hypothetical protein